MKERNNHKTMRISDEALNYIESFEGNTFNDKVNNMIDYFISKQKHYDQEIMQLDITLQKKKDKLHIVDTQLKEANKMLYEIIEILR